MSMEAFVDVFRDYIEAHGRASSIEMFNSQGDDGGSDSGRSNGDSDAISSDSDSSDEETVSDDDDSIPDAEMADISDEEDEFVGNQIAGNTVNVHAVVVHDSIHCPPFDEIDNTLHGCCDCAEFGMGGCCRLDDFVFFGSIDFETLIAEAIDTVNDEGRMPNNILRKKLYRSLFLDTNFGILEKKERRKLPNCGVAKVRQMFPSTSGNYMGYKEN